MEPRPRIKLILSPLDKTLERLGIFFLVTLWVITLYVYWKMPQTIPTHFNAAGQPDSFGNKGTLFFLPVLGSLIFAGITALNKHPHIFNYLTPITEHNAAQQYAIATRAIRFIKLVVLIIVIAIVGYTYRSTNGTVGEFGKWLLPIILALVLLPVIYLIIQLTKVKT